MGAPYTNRRRAGKKRSRRDLRDYVMRERERKVYGTGVSVQGILTAAVVTTSYEILGELFLKRKFTEEPAALY
jgi:hypothetical protein